MAKIYLKPVKSLLCTALMMLLSPGVHAQIKTLYKYNDLSHIYYADTKDSLEENWLCPSIYKEKATQKKYKEIWEEQKEILGREIDRRCFVYEKVVYNYVDSILTQIVAANPKLIKRKPFLLLDRSSYVNAHTMSGNMIKVNLGLITFVRTREDLALVIAHELSHGILKHPDNLMKEVAELVTSDEYKESIKSVLDSKYGRYSRLVNIFKDYSFSRSKHSRYHESEADSLAIVLLKASKIAYDPNFLLQLDSADIQYRSPLKQPLKNYFAAYNLSPEDWWLQKKSKGLSTRAYNFKDTTGIEDSLKTHPDCKQRYDATAHFADKGAVLAPIPQAVHERATRMLIWNMYDDNMLTTCLYRVLMEKDNGNTDVWYDFMIHNIFGGLVYADKQLNRFNAIGVLKKEYISANYYELQNMLEQMPKDDLRRFYDVLRSAPFWAQMGKDAVGMKDLLYNIITDNGDQAYKADVQAYRETYSNSMYKEYTDHFTRK
jgi:hypothetical protein